jgi:hypothetical protein
MEDENFYDIMRDIVYEIIESSTAKALSKAPGGGFVDITPGKEYFGPGAGNLPGSTGGGTNDDWDGSLPKLIEVLPEGVWKGGHKRATRNTASGKISDHYSGQPFSYAVDFMFPGAFQGSKELATAFAIAVVNNSRKQSRNPTPIKSWAPYVGTPTKLISCNVVTNDGYRVQVIWQCKDHYDHVHVGVKKLNPTR